ncbi:hypothetical protein KUCAC02_032461, partial [Chaenocephalus aceratus]
VADSPGRGLSRADSPGRGLSRSRTLQVADSPGRGLSRSRTLQEMVLMLTVHQHIPHAPLRLSTPMPHGLYTCADQIRTCDLV